MRSTGERWSRSGDTRQDPPIRDTQRDSLVSYSAGYSAESLWWDSRRRSTGWRDARRDPLAGCSGRILGGIHWRAALAKYLSGSTGEPLWRDTWRDALASSSGGILGEIHWPAALAGYLAGSTGEPLAGSTARRDPRRAALAGYSAGSTARWDPPASRFGGILGRIHWRAALARYWRDPLASCSGGILGGIHWRAALAGYWVGAWCRSIANADSNIKSNNPFLSGGELLNTKSKKEDIDYSHFKIS